MDTTEIVILDALKELLEDEFKEFKFHLSNSGTKDNPIPRGTLEKVNRHDVVTLMVQKHKSSDAGKIAVRVLHRINQNELADQLERKLPEGGASSGAAAANASTAGVNVTINSSSGGTVKAPVIHGVQQPVQEDTRDAPEPMELQPIQADWHRPHSITACSQQFKRILLTQEGNDVYIPTSRSQRKGSALLITNIVFDDERANRYGAEKDEENMDWLLTALGYSVEKHRNLSGNEIKRAVENFSKRYEHRDSDSTFVVIMSHGKRIENRDVILGVHYHDKWNPSDVYFIDETFSYLNSENCPALINKPKVILIQACRGKHDGGVYVHDSVPESDSWVHREKDFACFMSTLPGVKAYRSPVDGSYFISYIVDEFSMSAHKYDVMELFRKITLRMANDQHFTHWKKILPCMERTSLVKKFYLFPGL